MKLFLKMFVLKYSCYTGTSLIGLQHVVESCPLMLVPLWTLDNHTIIKQRLIDETNVFHKT